MNIQTVGRVHVYLRRVRLCEIHVEFCWDRVCVNS